MLSARRASERGSVAVVAIVLVLLAGLTGVLVQRNLSDGQSTRVRQDRAVALAGVDVGFSELAAQAAMTDSKQLEVSGKLDGGSWTATGQRVGDDRWEVTVEATAWRVTRRVTAALVRSPETGWVVTEWREG